MAISFPFVRRWCLLFLLMAPVTDCFLDQFRRFPAVTAASFWSDGKFQSLKSSINRLQGFPFILLAIRLSGWWWRDVLPLPLSLDGMNCPPGFGSSTGSL
ncbi:hypothetical protein LINPERPRIM_LOCUS29696 [Linum perenne]